MTAAERIEAMWKGQLTLSQLCAWASRRSQEVPRLGGEFAWIAMQTPEWAEPAQQRRGNVVQLPDRRADRAAASRPTARGAFRPLTRSRTPVRALARSPPRGHARAWFSRNDDLVIANGVGHTLRYTRLRKAFAKAAKDAKIAGATPHICRHTFASSLIHQGASVEFVSDQFGHASTKTTWDIYVHLFRARDQAAAAKRELDAAFGHMLRAVGEEPPGD